MEVSKEEGEQRREAFGRYFAWLEARQVEGTKKYVERYKLQTCWIRKMRKKATKEEKPVEPPIPIPNKEKPKMEVEEERESRIIE